MLRKSYYLTLGVGANESAAGIRQAFRQVVKRYHPDRVGDERAGFFRQIVEAYHVLADPERRKNYDRGLYHAHMHGTSAPTSVPIGESGQSAVPQALSILRTIYVKDAPFEAALARVSGSLTEADVSSREYCEALNAGVMLSAAEAERGGIVFLVVPSCSPCESCRGAGRQGMFACEACDGEGLLEEAEIVRVLVPPGAGDGTLMTLPLRGLGVHNFYLRLHVRVGS